MEQTTSEKLWAQYVEAPDKQPNIANVSFAGYRFGERALPAPKAVADVRAEGAKGDGLADDTRAFQGAIDKARKAGGGAVNIPEGTYKLSDLLVLDRDGLVLRGQGPGKTVLQFDEPAPKLAAKRGLSIVGSWYGGAVWLEPGGPKNSHTAVLPAEPMEVVKPAAQGDTVVWVSAESAAKLAKSAGAGVQMTWRGGRALCVTIAGHKSMEGYDFGDLGGAYREGVLCWEWANEITGVEGQAVRLKKPLRLSCGGEVKLTLGLAPAYLSECGVEGVSIRFPVTTKKAHLREDGYNGVCLRRSMHCWVRDVIIENADNGILFAGEAVNNTATGWRLIGRPNHHGTMMREMSHDNLIEDFVIASKPHHGLNTEGVSSGNVWRSGILLDGTFDSHGMMSFDSVRTNIVMNNTGGPGGKGSFGPFIGRRMTHWNVRVTNGRADWIAQPAILPSGAIVGIRGAELDLKADKLWLLPPGLDKGCVVADMGRQPRPGDLYAAQVERRRQQAAGSRQQEGGRGEVDTTLAVPRRNLASLAKMYEARGDAGEAKRLGDFLTLLGR